MEIFNVLAVIGALSWLYPVGILIYKTFVRPKIRVSPANSVRIGYTEYGPIVSLRCAVSTQRQDALIERIEAKVTHDDGEAHTLVWNYLSETQSTLMPFSGEGGGTVSRNEPAIALQINRTALSHKVIAFQDDHYTDKLNPIARTLIEKVDFCEKTTPTEVASLLNSQDFVALIQFFRNNFYWKAGKYLLELGIHAVSLKELQTETFTFEILQTDTDTLKRNFDLLESNLKASVLAKTSQTEKSSLSASWNWIDAEISRAS